MLYFFFFFQAEDGIRDGTVTGVQTCLFRSHDDAGGIEIVFGAEAVAGRARAVGRIEAEGARLKLRDGNAAIGASELFGEDVVLAADDGDGDEAGGELEGGGDR